MANKLTLCLHDGEIANLMNYFIVSQRLTGSMQDTRVYVSAVIDYDHYLVGSRINLKLMLRKGNYVSGSYNRL